MRTLPLRAVVLLVLSLPVAVMSQGRDAAIVGEVIGGRHGPIVGATVTTSPPTRSVVTNDSGVFVLDGIPRGRYRVTVARDGESVSFDWPVRGRSGPLTIRLPIWKLTWADEFDSTAVDLDRWEMAEGGSGVEDHRQRFRSRAMSVAGGRLRITTVPDSTEPGYYTGGMILSRRRFVYGRFEVRAKLPTGQGMWPGHWFWSHHNAPEIDIIEMLGRDPHTLHHTYHYGNWRGTRRRMKTTSRGPDYSKGYHRFALEWFPNEYIWYVDGREVFRAPVLQPDEPLSFVLCTFVGGNWGGDPDETTVFPQFHDIDYARVWEAAE